MADSAYQFIADQSPLLMRVLNSNYSLSSFLQSFYANLIHSCSVRAVDPKDVRVRNVTVNETTLVADLSFPRKSYPTNSTYRRYIQRTFNIEYMMRTNESVRLFLWAVVGQLQNWCRTKQITLEEVEIGNSIITRSSGRLIASIRARL